MGKPDPPGRGIVFDQQISMVCCLVVIALMLSTLAVGAEVVLADGFKEGVTKGGFYFGSVQSVTVRVEGATSAGIAATAITWTGHDDRVHPWEQDPAPVSEGRDRTWWPGISRNNAGHFGWRYEPNSPAFRWPSIS